MTTVFSSSFIGRRKGLPGSSILGASRQTLRFTPKPQSSVLRTPFLSVKESLSRARNFENQYWVQKQAIFKRTQRYIKSSEGLDEYGST